MSVPLTGSRRLFVAVTAAALLGGACASGQDAGDETSSTSMDSVAGTAESAGAPEPAMAPDGDGSMEDGFSGEVADAARAGAASGSPGGELVFAQTGAVAGRQLARTARLELVVDDVEQAAAQVRGLVARVGGFISSAEVRGGEDGWGVLTLRVPATALDGAVDELADLAAEVRLSQIGTEDLTDQLTDADARLANLRALETELRALLAEIRARTSNAGELLVIFEQVNQVRLEIERLDASRASLADRVALATITVDLRPVSSEGIVEPVVDPSTLEQAWAATRNAFGTMGDALIWAGVTIVPVGLVLLTPAALAAWAFSRRRARTASPTA